MYLTCLLLTKTELSEVLAGILNSTLNFFLKSILRLKDVLFVYGKFPEILILPPPNSSDNLILAGNSVLIDKAPSIVPTKLFEYISIPLGSLEPQQ